MSKNRRGGYRQPAKPAPVGASGPGAGKGQNRTDGGPANVKQPIRRLPDAGYNENKAFVQGQQAVNGLPRTQPDAKTIVKSAKPQVFAGTELQGQDPRAGGATGGGLGVDRIALAADDVDIFLDVLEERDPTNIYIRQLKNTRYQEAPR